MVCQAARYGVAARKRVSMSYSEVDLRPAIQFDETTRGDFVVRVYQHLLGAIAAFAAIEALFINLGIAERIMEGYEPEDVDELGDSIVAILDTVRALSLVGVRAPLTGVSPAIARTLARTGYDGEQLEFHRNVRAALAASSNA